MLTKSGIQLSTDNQKPITTYERIVGSKNKGKSQLQISKDEVEGYKLHKIDNSTTQAQTKSALQENSINITIIKSYRTAYEWRPIKASKTTLKHL